MRLPRLNGRLIDSRSGLGRFSVILFVLVAAITPAALGQCDPLELGKLIASDAASSDFIGRSVAISGDTAVVGSPDDNHAGGVDAGSAYVFVQSGGVWSQQAKLVASDAAGSDRFGISVAISGDTVLIGAYMEDEGGLDAGSAYVFVRNEGVWTEQAKLTASQDASNDRFGNAVALSGDTAVIGSYLDNQGSFADAGSAYVFVRSGGLWTEQAVLTASDKNVNDHFGTSVSVSGDTAVIGAVDDDHAGGTDAGSAYVFVRSGAVWTQQAKLTASDAAANEHFGNSIAVSGDTVVVGESADSNAGGGVAGSAYVFLRVGSVWSQQAKLTASDAAAFDEFGISVAVSDDATVIGSHGDDHAGGTGAGSVYVFSRSGSVWTEAAKLTASDAAPSDFFGRSVALSGQIVVVGASGDDHPPRTDAGSAYVFDLCPPQACDPCDANCDGSVNPFDIQPFIALLGLSPSPCSPCAGDADQNGTVNPFDINGFLTCLMP